MNGHAAGLTLAIRGAGTRDAWVAAASPGLK